MKWPYPSFSLSVQVAQPSGGPRSRLIPCSLRSIRRETGKPSREQMLHMPYDEPGRIGVGWPRSEFADEPDGVLTDAGLRR